VACASVSFIAKHPVEKGWWLLSTILLFVGCATLRGGPMVKEQPIEFRHALDFYKLLTQRAVSEDGVLEFRGSIVEAFRSLGISQSYYSPITRGLYDSGAMSMKQRGARGTVSIIVLHEQPTAATWIKSRLTTRSKPATLSEQQLEDILQQLGGINIVEALANHEARIKALEQQGVTHGKEAN